MCYPPSSMRFLLYNIAYGTGAPRSAAHRAFTLHRYLRAADHHIHRIQQFIAGTDPDLVGLVELDTGSMRAGGRNHAAEFARVLSHQYTYCSKYRRGSVGRVLPILRHQGNALFSRQPLEACQHHFLPAGFKRLVLEARTESVHIFLVHLALNQRTREKQLRYLARLVGEAREPVIVAGDFNVFRGATELGHLIEATGLRTVNAKQSPTYPSWKPTRELDFMLCSPAVRVTGFKVLTEVKLSDHLPLQLDFELDRDS